MELLIYNGSRDSIVINDFNKYICHASTFHYKGEQQRVFFWDLLAISNKESEGVVITFSIAPTIKIPEKQLKEKNINIVIPSGNMFISDVYMWHSPFVFYPKEYYKLCLYHEQDKNKCIAEIIIKND